MSFGPFYIGDVPSVALNVTISRDGEVADLSGFAAAEPLVVGPDGAPVDWDAAATIEANGVVSVAIPTTSPFALAGTYSLWIRLTAPGGVRETTGPSYIEVRGTTRSTDMIGTPDELALIPDVPELSRDTAELLLSLATSVVQSKLVTGQRLVTVLDDEITLLGTTDSWLDLPERPVVEVSEITVDGTELTEGTDFHRFGARLFRTCGWAEYALKPSTIVLTYSHGYGAEDPGLVPAKTAVLMLAASAAKASGGITSESIDDYQVVYDRMASQMQAADGVVKMLRQQYGRRAGVARIG